MRDDIRPGLRMMSYKNREVIALQVDDGAKQVNIPGVCYGGHDYETMLGEPDNIGRFARGGRRGTRTPDHLLVRQVL